jgi:DNA-binding response OmpR family regulator
MAQKKKWGPTTVLVVDDEQCDRSSASQALLEDGHKVLVAENYSEAMAIFYANIDHITLLVADLALPDGNGCVLAVAMRNQKPDLRVLFISGHVGTEACKYYGLELDDLHLLEKPFQPSEFLNRVRMVLTARNRFPRLVVPKTFTSTG